MKSYLRGDRGIRANMAELLALYRQQTQDIPRRVADHLDIQRDTVRRLEDLRGAPLLDCDVLELGPGQTRIFLMATGLTNRAVGVDIEPAPDRLGLAELWRIWRKNGPLRLVKTVGRHALGVDRRTRAELTRQLGVPPLN